MASTMSALPATKEFPARSSNAASFRNARECRLATDLVNAIPGEGRPQKEIRRAWLPARARTYEASGATAAASGTEAGLPPERRASEKSGLEPSGRVREQRLPVLLRLEQARHVDERAHSRSDEIERRPEEAPLRLGKAREIFRLQAQATLGFAAEAIPVPNTERQGRTEQAGPAAKASAARLRLRDERASPAAGGGEKLAASRRASAMPCARARRHGARAPSREKRPGLTTQRGREVRRDASPPRPAPPSPGRRHRRRPARRT